MLSARTISKGIISVGTWSATKLLVTGLVVPVYSRLLGIEGYGQYAYYVALLMLASQPANCGMRVTLTKYIAERRADPAWHRAVASYAGRVTASAAAIVGLGVLLLVLLSARSAFQAALLAVMVVGILWTEQVHQHASGILYGLQREEESTVPASVGLALGGAVGVALVILDFGLLGALTGMLLSGALVAAVTLHLARRALDSGSAVEQEPELPRPELLRFGLWSMAYAGIAMMLYSIDVLLVRHFAGDHQTGLYAAAVQWSEFVWFVPIAIEGVMLQSTAQLWAHGQVERITQLMSRLMRYVALATAFLLLYVLVFAEHIVTVYFGADFRDAAVPLQLLIPGAFAFSLARVMRPVIQARGGVVLLLKIIAAVTVVNVLLNVLLVPRWGASGAAVAASLSFIGATALFIWVLEAEGVRPFHGLSGGRFAVLCTATVVLLVPIALATWSSVMALVLGGLVMVGFYWCAVFWLGLIRVKELQQIVDSLPVPLRQIGGRLIRVLQPMLMRLDAIALS